MFKVFQSATGLLWIAVSRKKNRFVNVRFIFYLSIIFCWFRFVFLLSRFVSFRFCLLRFVTVIFGYGRKNIIRISYQNVHHFSASCALCNFLRFIENKKYIWLIPNPFKVTINTVTPWSSMQWKPTPWSNLRVVHETTQSTPLNIYLWS
jgi:hypothetical protein